MSPMTRGRNGSGRLRSGANRPSAASVRLSCSRRRSSSPSPTGRIVRPSIMRLPRFVQNVGLACTTTRAPSRTAGPIALSVFVGTVRERDMSTSASRSVKYAVRARMLSCTICPSTHSGDMRSTYCAIFMLSTRTGHGCSAVVSPARAGRPAGVPVPGGVLVTGQLYGGEAPRSGAKDECGGEVRSAGANSLPHSRSRPHDA